jgi:4-hydroxy-3-methylbut-2-enyl diphosphate reductase
VEVAQQAGARAAFRVDRAAEIRAEWLAAAVTVGVTSGASVPEILVQDVITHLGVHGFDNVAEVRTVTEELMFSLPHELRSSIKAAGRDVERPRRDMH